MELTVIGDIVKVYGPLGIGWVLAAYLIWFIVNRWDKNMEAQISLARALEGLTQIIKERVK